MLIEAMFNYIQQHACKMAYVGLMATPGTEEFYEKFGFIRRPTDGLGCGTVLYISEANHPNGQDNKRGKMRCQHEKGIGIRQPEYGSDN